MQTIISQAIMTYMFFSIIGGYVADKVGPYKVAFIAIILVLITSIYLCLYLNKLILNQHLFILISAIMPCITMPAAFILKQSIPIAIRYRIFSLSHAVGSVIISAPTAYLSTLLYHKTNIVWIPIVYFICSIIMIFYSLYYLNKRTIKDI